MFSSNFHYPDMPMWTQPQIVEYLGYDKNIPGVIGNMLTRYNGWEPGTSGKPHGDIARCSARDNLGKPCQHRVFSALANAYQRGP